MYSKFSFGEVHRRIYCLKFSFTVTLEQSDRISDDLPQSPNEILNLVIPFYCVSRY